MEKDIKKIEWGNPDEFFQIIKCTSDQYAQNFIKCGEIKFSTPQSWVEYGEKYGDGRGDVFEGTIAYCHKTDWKKILELKNELYNIPDLEVKMYYDYALFKSRRSLSLPCLCFFALKVSNFQIPHKAGKQKVIGNIPGEYFSQFAANFLPDDYSQMEERDRPIAYVVDDYNEFRRRLVSHLVKLGVSPNEIFFTMLGYYDFTRYGASGWANFSNPSPLGLTIKRLEFKKQNELRIIINTRDRSIRELLVEEPIHIGSMEDITKKIEGYPRDGLRIEATAILEDRDR